MDSHQMIERGDLKYYFHAHSITVDYHDQFIAFNSHMLNNRKKFRVFRRTLENSSEDKFDSMNDLYGLARKLNIKATAGHRPTIVDTIAF